MSVVVRIRDEFFGEQSKEVEPAGTLTLASEQVSLREIIRQRVFTEVADVNEKRIERSRARRKTRSFLIDVETGSTEDTLNPLRPLAGAKRNQLDAEAEFERALRGFQSNRYVILLDDRQVESLEEPVTVTPDTEITFLHLMPLKGG
ncbi:MAG: hypothetical protein AAGA34_08255 [Pseudomonadota bacterium]